MPLQHLQQLVGSSNDTVLRTGRSGRTTRSAVPTYRGEVAVPDLKSVSKHCMRGTRRRVDKEKVIAGVETPAIRPSRI